MNISIVTPVSRLKNIPLLKESITFPCQWYIVVDSDRNKVSYSDSWIHTYNVPSSPNGVSGNKQRNFALDQIKDNSWVYFLDDDTIIHKDFYSTLAKYESLYSEYSAWVFNQSLEGGGERWATKDNIKVEHIDQAQYIVRRDMIDGLRFRQQYSADGVFIETLYKQYPERFGHILQPLCWYNKLKWA